jgi:hypothetical protein
MSSFRNTCAEMDVRAWQLLTSELDDKVIFPFGPLDQGYWPDGKSGPTNSI